jgi:hypothetical protein
MKLWEKEKRAERKQIKRWDEPTIIGLKDRPEWKELKKMVLARASSKKIKLYSEDLSRREFESGRLIGWLACCEFMLNLPDSLETRMEKSDGKES